MGNLPFRQLDAERRIHSPSAQMKQAEARMCVKASFNFETKQCQAPTDA
ncbi:MAG: hypothetical protein ACI8T1_002139, partial [Verrucomicrobiales bacterium]